MRRSARHTPENTNTPLAISAVPDTPEDINMEPDPTQSQALVTTQPHQHEHYTQSDQPTQPTTHITEVTDSTALDTPPSRQVAQTLTHIPKLDFKKALAALPTNY
jgi:hypothetical protein